MQIETPFSIPIVKSFLGNEEIQRELFILCLDQQKISKGVIKSNQGGWQSDEMNCDNEVINKFWHLCIPHLQSFLDLYEFAFNYDLVLDAAWINVNYKYSYNSCHIHPGSHFSSVYYIQAPIDSGHIRIRNPNTGLTTNALYYKPKSEFNDFNTPAYSVVPEDRKLITFPSYLWHEVLPNLNDEKRVSLAFNWSIEQKGNDS